MAEEGWVFLLTAACGWELWPPQSLHGHQEGVVCYFLMGNEVPDPSLASLSPPWCKGWGTWLQPGRGESRVLPLSLGARVERWRLSCFFRCLAGVEKLSSKSLAFLGCPFPGPLARESRLLLGFFCLLSMAFLGCQVLKLQVWDM